MASLSIAQAISASIGVCLLYRFGVIVYRLYFHPLSKYPGPKHLAISGLPQMYYQNVTGTFYKDIRALHDQHGNIVRVAPNELSIDGSIGWTEAYGHKKAGELEFKKDRLFYRPLESGQGVNGSGVHDIFTASREDHRRQRRLIAHAFSDAALTEQEELIQTYVDLLMTRFRENAALGKVLDMVKFFNFLTFDLIGDLAFGDPFDCLQTSTMNAWISMIYIFVKASSQLRIFAEYPLLKPLLRLIITKSAQDQVKKSMDYTGEKLERRLALGKNLPRKDFLSYILRHNDEKGMSHPEIMGNSESFIVAGSETTATLLSGLTYFLGHNPAAWQRLTTEIRESFSSEKDITMRAASALPYLHACIEEGLRMYPPAALTPPRISPGANIDGNYIPEGTKIWIHQWSTYHRNSNFAMADNFIPERWLPQSHAYYEPQFANDNQACMQPFSYGPRNCIGKNLAYAEIRLAMAKMAWNFEIEIMPECTSWMEGQKVFTVFQKPPLFVKLHLRAGREEKEQVEQN
ncbi:cytochrome P450 3A17 [Mollisia scopiformis]|uniref:Cytochrome P450 3A17 n=1 Tax=Mollisia scopiformis TaxID=149040 RepID=A0A194WVL3_MOLSC|nr:cytochrome P450 3A17 [Mollisia scopiformis]KUJ11632.1 cytochrome P450 3A17 [Mollisia scopiformis]